ncbi:hypothetical protein TRVL_05092 [Trypanosoma vivax]|nr:hypothetical protein TRVL_05092 [Trypanosoma vivax]
MRVQRGRTGAKVDVRTEHEQRAATTKRGDEAQCDGSAWKKAICTLGLFAKCARSTAPWRVTRLERRAGRHVYTIHVQGTRRRNGNVHGHLLVTLRKAEQQRANNECREGREAAGKARWEGRKAQNSEQNRKGHNERKTECSWEGSRSTHRNSA